MTVVRRPSPFGELLSLRQAMDRLFEDSFVRPGRWLTASTAADGSPMGSMPLDVHVTGDELVVQAQLPGVKPEDLDVTVENGTLTIAAETSSETRNEERNFLVHEIRRGSVSRTIPLPDGLEPDRARAEFENGILTLRVPRAEQVKPRTIRITPTVGGHAGEIGAAGAARTTGDAAVASASESGNDHTGSSGDAPAGV
jgi:HSP20 family protein